MSNEFRETNNIIKLFFFYIKINITLSKDRLFGIVVSTSDCHPSGPGSIPGYTLEIFLGV